MIRGDRRKEIRKEERRAAVRTPGKMKKIMDAVYKTERTMKAK
jgi:hypothetical protein